MKGMLFYRLCRTYNTLTSSGAFIHACENHDIFEDVSIMLSDDNYHLFIIKGPNSIRVKAKVELNKLSPVDMLLLKQALK